jgi:hypothetical protein
MRSESAPQPSEPMGSELSEPEPTAVEDPPEDSAAVVLPDSLVDGVEQQLP